MKNRKKNLGILFGLGVSLCFSFSLSAQTVPNLGFMSEDNLYVSKIEAAAVVDRRVDSGGILSYATLKLRLKIQRTLCGFDNLSDSVFLYRNGLVIRKQGLEHFSFFRILGATSSPDPNGCLALEPKYRFRMVDLSLPLVSYIAANYDQNQIFQLEFNKASKNPDPSLSIQRRGLRLMVNQKQNLVQVLNIW